MRMQVRAGDGRDVEFMSVALPGVPAVLNAARVALSQIVHPDHLVDAARSAVAELCAEALAGRSRGASS